MKKIFLLLLLSVSAHAIELSFIGPCEEAPIMKTRVTKDFTNVGELTVETLKHFGIPFIGTAEGLSSAFMTPIGEEALEVISDKEMRAYGWCYSVDGITPELYPHEIPVTSETKKIVWHFGYARFFEGQWVTQCSASYKVKPSFLCKDPIAE